MPRRRPSGSSTVEDMLAQGAMNLIPGYLEAKANSRFSGAGDIYLSQHFPDATRGSIRALSRRIDGAIDSGQNLTIVGADPELRELVSDPMVSGRNTYGYYVQPHIGGTFHPAGGGIENVNMAPVVLITSNTPLTETQLQDRAYARAQVNLERGSVGLAAPTRRAGTFTRTSYELIILGIVRGV